MHGAVSNCVRKKGLELSFSVGKGVDNTGRSGFDWLILLLPATMNITVETEKDQGTPARGDIKVHKT